MEISVHARHLEVPVEIRELAAEKVENLGRFLEGTDQAEVLFFADHAGRDDGHVCCEVMIVARGRFVRARAHGDQPTVALDAAIDKAAHRLRRMKERLVQRSRPRHGSAGHPTPAPIVPEAHD
jgi:ribosomal subunit interface protein